MAYYSDIFVSGAKYGRTPKVSFKLKPTPEIKQQELEREELGTAQESGKVVAEQGDKMELLQQAIKLHDKGALENDKEAVVKAYELLKKLSRSNPEDPVINAYYGSSITLMARDGTDPIKRMKDVRKGLGILDGVVRNAPDNIQARILRGNVCFRLPEIMFHRNATAVEDFSYLVNRYEQNSSVFSRDFYLQLLANLSTAYRNIGKKEESQKVEEKLQSLGGEKASEKAQPMKQGERKKEAKAPEDSSSKSTAGPAGQLSKIPVEILANIPPNFLANLPPNIREQLNAFLQNVPTNAEKPAPVQEESKISSEERAKLVEEAKKLYLKAKKGGQEDKLRAFNFLREAYETIPEDNTIAAYYADCLIAVGLEASDMGSMFPNLFKGMKILNRALENEPDNLELRFLRGYLAFRLPETFFHRTATAKEDFEYIIRRYEEDNSLFSVKTYWQVLYDLALVYRRLNMPEELKATLKKLKTKSPELYNQMAEVGKRIADCEFIRVHPLQEFFFLP